jgi:glycosyltransferase involved in cell wall biosynthesis
MKTIFIVTPVYNDWPALSRLLEELESLAAEQGLTFHVLAVNDGSSSLPVSLPAPGRGVTSLQILHLTRNLGHQRAIAIGLAWAYRMGIQAPVIVMDCDGEDRPQDIPRLLAESERCADTIIFARRTRRTEGWLFRLFYVLFKFVFRLLTGRAIAFGNFCLIPPSLLGRVVYLQEIWNHFAAGILRAGLPWTSIPAARGRRYAGASHMSLVPLVLHGLSAISVYVEIVYVRLIFFALALLGLDLAGFLVLLYIRFLTPLAIPGWATTVAVGLTLLASQAFLFLALLTFLLLSYRSARMFIPATDYQAYVLEVEQWER